MRLRARRGGGPGYKGHDRLYLEDFTVGQRFISATHRLDADQIKVFAQHFDPQPFHLDEVAAQASFFKGLAASGWHTAVHHHVADGQKRHADRGRVDRGGGELQWPRPARPGDVLQVESEVLEVKLSRSKPERGMVTVKSITRNQNGEDVQVLTSRMLVWKRPVCKAAATFYSERHMSSGRGAARVVPRIAGPMQSGRWVPDSRFAASGMTMLDRVG